MKKAEGAERSIKANGGFLFLPSRSSQRSFGFPYRQKSLRFIFFFPPFPAFKWVFKRHLLIHFFVRFFNVIILSSEIRSLACLLLRLVL